MRTYFDVMNRFLGIVATLLVWFSAVSWGQPPVITASMLHKPLVLSEAGKWRFHKGDDSAYAAQHFNDSTWLFLNTSMNFDSASGTLYKGFTGIAWFRFHFIADSSIANQTIALLLMHYGASDVYFDGKKIQSFGTIKDSSTTLPEIPRIPCFFYTTTTGEHVIAVRYANYHAVENWRKFQEPMAGFTLKMGIPEDILNSMIIDDIFGNYFLIILSMMFFVLSFSHLFLYLYYRPLHSNLWFSLFCFAFSIVFFVPLLSNITLTPSVTFYKDIILPVDVALLCLALSGLINSLFVGNKLRFRIVAFMAMGTTILYFFNTGAGSLAYASIICLVALEAIVVIVQAILKKVAGALIIGTGFMFFLLFLVVTLVYLIFNHNITLDGGPLSTIVSLSALAALVSLPISISLYLAWNFANVNKTLAHKLAQVKDLSAQTIAQELEKKALLENQKALLEEEVTARTAEVVAQKNEIHRQHDQLRLEKQKSDDLLLNILPHEVAEELKEKGHSNARLFDNVTILFTDFVDFTRAAERMGPQELVDELHSCFQVFDGIIDKYNIEKIKTIGDAYMAVSGLPVNYEGNATNIVKAALEIRNFMRNRKEQFPEKSFEIRMGIHSGSVIAGIVGIKKFAYDIWGDTVNTAARMEQNSLPGKINISQPTYELVNTHFQCEYRGEITAKNKGPMKMYFVDRLP